MLFCREILLPRLISESLIHGLAACWWSQGQQKEAGVVAQSPILLQLRARHTEWDHFLNQIAQ